MKHIYIITIILSSFFTYSPIYAKDNSLQYAFFIPQDAFQHNIFNEPTQVEVAPKTSNNQTTQTTTKEIDPQKTKAIEKTSNKTQTNKYTKKIITASSRAPIKMKNNTKEYEQTKPSLTEEPLVQKITTELIQNAKKTLPETKSISETLSEIPYPSDNMPKYQKAYLDYIMSLRILYRTKKLQPNLKQEKTLAKANSLKRFDI